MATSYNFRVDGRDERRFRALTDAERWARAQCAKSGETHTIKCLMNGRNGELVAYVRRDNTDRIWTDVCRSQDSLI